MSAIRAQMFQFCRLCMVPQKFANLSSLYDGDGSKALMFKQLFDIDINVNHIERNEALTCDDCSNEMTTAFKFREKVRNYDKFYFKVACKEIEANIPEVGNNSLSTGISFSLLDKHIHNFTFRDISLTRLLNENQTKSITMSIEDEITIKHTNDIEIHQPVTTVPDALLLENAGDSTNENHQMTKDLNAVDLVNSDTITVSDEESNEDFRTFKAPTKLPTRKTVLDKQRARRCEICLRLFKTPKAAISHRKIVHEHQKSYDCSICLKQFLNTKTLYAHIQIKHNNIEVDETSATSHNLLLDQSSYVKCIICHKKMLGKSLENHIRKHHSVKNEQTGTGGLSNVVDKKIIHQSKKLNIWVCFFPGCRESFKIYSDLKLHRKQHFRVQCKFCNLITSTCNIKRHIKKHHPEESK